jgi:hypothetical protein
MLPALAAKAATTSIPIVSAVGTTRCSLGLLLASIGNLTGFNGFIGELGAKGLAARACGWLVASVHTI